MKANRVLLFVLLLFLLPSAWAQSPGTDFEDYEDMTAGLQPVDSTFADITVYSGCSGPCVESSSNARFFVESGGFGGSSKRIQGFEPTGGDEAWYVLTDASTAGWDYTSFWLDAENDGEAQLHFCGNTAFNFFHGRGDTGAEMFFLRMQNTAAGAWDVRSYCVGGDDFELDSTGNEGPARFIEVYMDFAADEADVYLNGILKGTMPFCDNISYWSRLGLDPINLAGGDGRIYFDEWTVADLSEVLTPLTPGGVEATVEKTGSTSTTGRVEIRWLLSANDPNQETGDFGYDVYLNGTFLATDTVDANDGDGVRAYTYTFTGSTSFGNATFQVKATTDIVESDLSCSVTVNRDVLGSSDTCGSVVPVADLSPSEFSGGLDATVESWGFITAESKMLFVMALVGGSTVGLGAFAKWVAPGRWKNYALMGIGVMLALVGVFITYLETWIFLISFILALFVVRGGQAARNTYFEVRDALSDLREHGRTGVETKADLTMPPGDFMGATDTEDANDDVEDFEEEIVDEVPEEIEIDFSEADRE